MRKNGFPTRSDEQVQWLQRLGNGHTSHTGALASLRDIQVIRAYLDQRERFFVAQLRRDDGRRVPVSWDRIGNALGVTRQSAMRRFR